MKNSKKLSIATSEVNVLKAFDRIHTAIMSRIEKAENSNAAKELQKSNKLFTLHLASVLVKENADIENLASVIEITERNDENFFAQKALIKMMKIIQTLSQDLDRLDSYTRNFLTSVLICDGTISNKEIMQGSSKDVVTENLKLRKNARQIAISTATTQTSSDRRMLSFAKIISYDNSKHMQTFTSNEMQARIAKIINYQD